MVLANLPSTIRAIALSQRGFGNSDKPEGSYHPRDLASDLADFMTLRRIPRAILAGHSMGALVAQSFAVQFPERVAGLVLIGTAVSGAPQAELDETEQRFDALFEAAIEAGDDAEVNRLDMWFWLDGPSSPEGRVGGAARDLALEMNAIIIGNDAPEDAGDNGVDAWSRLAEITVPVTVACGALDARFIVARARELARRLPKAGYVELPGVAHQPYLEQPDAVASLIREAIA